MTKEKLRRYQSIKAELRQLAKLWDECMDNALAAIEETPYAAATQKLTGMPHGSAPKSGSKQEHAADRMLDGRATQLQWMYYEKMNALIDEQMAIERAIDSLEPTLRCLLRYKYIQGMTWEEICVEMDYSWRQIHRLHSKALEMLKGVD